MCSCSDAIALDPRYSKAYMRRSAALEMLDDLDNALVDAKQVGQCAGEMWGCVGNVWTGDGGRVSG